MFIHVDFAVDFCKTDTTITLIAQPSTLSETRALQNAL